jgi:23S rRNA pseudouridine2605 synthase
VVALVDSEARLYPVGRLDADSTGLLLLTNDGELANRLTHPRYQVPKAYRVELDRPPAEADLRRLASGIELEDGITAPAEVERLGEREIEIVLREGRNRQVRRMAEAIGNRVTALRRVRFGPIELGALAEGDARRLSEDEIAALRSQRGVLCTDGVPKTPR